jgi:hypothetical protein
VYCRPGDCVPINKPRWMDRRQVEKLDGTVKCPLLAEIGD